MPNVGVKCPLCDTKKVIRYRSDYKYFRCNKCHMEHLVKDNVVAGSVLLREQEKVSETQKVLADMKDIVKDVGNNIPDKIERKTERELLKELAGDSSA